MSDIVLSLFAVDVLAYREFHEQNLCVCDVCGRISYNPRQTSRSRLWRSRPRDGGDQRRAEEQRARAEPIWEQP